MLTLDLTNPTNPDNYITIHGIDGFPIHWNNEVSGEMMEAFTAFYNGWASEDQLKNLIIPYIQYHIHAPVWLEKYPGTDGKPGPDGWVFAEEIRELRRLSLTLKTMEDIGNYINLSLEIGLDPL